MISANLGLLLYEKGLCNQFFRIIYRRIKRESKTKFGLVGISLGLFYKFAGSPNLIWLYAGFIELLSFKKDHCKQCYTFYAFIKLKCFGQF